MGYTREETDKIIADTRSSLVQRIDNTIVASEAEEMPAFDSDSNLFMKIIKTETIS